MRSIAENAVAETFYSLLGRFFTRRGNAMAPMIERDGIVVCHRESDVPSFMSDEYAVKLKRGSLAKSPSATAGM